MRCPFVSRRTHEREKRAARQEGEEAPLSNLMIHAGSISAASLVARRAAIVNRSDVRFVPTGPEGMQMLQGHHGGVMLVGHDPDYDLMARAEVRGIKVVIFPT